MTPKDINVKHCQCLQLLPLDLRKNIYVIASKKIIVDTINCNDNVSEKSCIFSYWCFLKKNSVWFLVFIILL